MPTRRLILELLEPSAEPITGTVVDESGRAVDFAGWLGLANALQTAIQPTYPLDGELERPTPRPGSRGGTR